MLIFKVAYAGTKERVNRGSENRDRIRTEWIERGYKKEAKSNTNFDTMRFVTQAICPNRKSRRNVRRNCVKRRNLESLEESDGMVQSRMERCSSESKVKDIASGGHCK